MAINDVSLTSGMRSNLLSLQNTVDLLNRTQSRLSTGKKVNSAMDNPVSFFASQALTSRASVIDSLKDAMGQAVQTITAADKGITAITSMIEQAKGIAQSALSATAGGIYDTETVTLNSLAAGDTIQIGATILTAGPSGVGTATALASQTITVSTAIDVNDTVVVGGLTFTAKAASSTAVSTISIDMSANTLAPGGTVTVGGVAYTAVASTSATSYDSYTLHMEDVQAGNSITVNGATYTAVASVATTSYDKFTVDFTNITAGDVVTVGGTGYTAVAGVAGANEFTIDTIAGAYADLTAEILADSPTNFAVSGLNVAAESFDITGADGHTLVEADVTTDSAGAGVLVADTTVTTNTVGVNQFKIVDGDDSGNSTRLKAAIDARQPGLYTVTLGGVADRDVTFAFTGDATTLAADSVDVGNTAGSLMAVGTTVESLVNTTVVGANQFVVSGDTAMDASNLTAKINALQGANYTATVGGSTITLVADGATTLAADTVTSNNGPIVISSSVTTTAANLGQFEFGIGADANATAANLSTKLSGVFGAQLGVANASSCNVISITSGTTDLTETTVTAGTAAADEIAIANTVTTSDEYADGYFNVTGTDADVAAALASVIADNAAITAAHYSATASNGVLTIANSTANVTAGNVLVSDAAKMVEETVAAASELGSLQTQYAEMLDQIDTLAADSGYKGKNLLASSLLSVKFEGDHKLDVQGFDASSSGLGITAATWTAGGSIDDNITALDAAKVTLQSQSSKLSGNLSVITVRQSFSTNMINTLTAGSDLLTAADANEEGANMLMLQTRQSLSTTALSLSAQAAQSVLKLFG